MWSVFRESRISFSSGPIATPKRILLGVISFRSITFIMKRASWFRATFRRVAMRRWDGFLDSSVEEYRARGIGEGTVAAAQGRLIR